MSCPTGRRTPGWGIAVDIARAEARHTPEADETWSESWYLDFFDAAGSLGGYVQLTLWPGLGRSWFWACLAGEDRPLVTVIENEGPVPPPPALELRASGLWADLNCETPAEHFVVGLEAFGVALEDPSEVFRGAWGDRTPLGFDLEWETEAPGAASHDELTDGYALSCEVHGEILVADQRIDFEGWGRRTHRWGVRRWWTDEPAIVARRGDGTWLVDDPDRVAAVAVAQAPVLLEGHPGGPTRLSRVLVRLLGPGGGAGWTAICEALGPP